MHAGWLAGGLDPAAPRSSTRSLRRRCAPSASSAGLALNPASPPVAEALVLAHEAAGPGGRCPSARAPRRPRDPGGLDPGGQDHRELGQPPPRRPRHRAGNAEPARQHRRGATGAVASVGVNPRQRGQADALLRSVGLVEWLTTTRGSSTRSTAVSGSGPAYVFLLAEVMAQAGIAADCRPRWPRGSPLHRVGGRRAAEADPRAAGSCART